MPMYWTFNCFLCCLYISLPSPKVTFKSWILMSEKKGSSCPNWGQGGWFRWFGQCPKENVFFIDVFPKRKIESKTLSCYSSRWRIKTSYPLFKLYRQSWWNFSILHGTRDIYLFTIVLANINLPQTFWSGTNDNFLFDFSWWYPSRGPLSLRTLSMEAKHCHPTPSHVTLSPLK